MTEFDEAKFEEKYVHYFPELQTAYKNAFSRLNDQYNSRLVHTIDQLILNESEPFYEGDGEFRIELPEDPTGRVTETTFEDEEIEEMLEIYVAEIEAQLRRIFGFE